VQLARMWSEEVGYSFDCGRQEPGRGSAREAEQRQHPVDIDEELGATGATFHGDGR
jgi:hypothetical protein